MKTRSILLMMGVFCLFACVHAFDLVSDSAAVQAILDHNNLSDLQVDEVSHADSVDGKLRIVSLHIWASRPNKIEISVPAEIGNLTALKSLVFGSLYRVVGNFPAEMANLKNLEKFQVWESNLDAIPDFVWGLDSLKDFALLNAFVREVPAQIGNLKKLEFLDLRGNLLEKVAPEIGQLSNLVNMNLGYNNLSAIPKEIGNYKTLYHLHLNSNRLKEIPAEIGNLDSLYVLYLSANELKSLPSSMGNLRKLSMLSIGSNFLTDIPNSMLEITSLDTGQLFVRPNYLCKANLSQEKIQWIEKYCGDPWYYDWMACDPSPTAAYPVDFADNQFSVRDSLSQAEVGFGVSREVAGVIRIREMNLDHFAGFAKGGKLIPANTALQITVGLAYCPDNIDDDKMTLTMDYGDIDISNVDENSLVIMRIPCPDPFGPNCHTSSWQYIGGTVDAVNKTITAEVGRYGFFAIFGDAKKPDVSKPCSTNVLVADSFFNVDATIASGQNVVGAITFAKDAVPTLAPNDVTYLKSVTIHLSDELQSAMESAELAICYSDQDVANIKESSLRIYYLNKGIWELVGGTVDSVGNRVNVTVTHFSTYGIFGAEKGSSVQSQSIHVRNDFQLAVTPTRSGVMFQIGDVGEGGIQLDVRNIAGRLVWSCQKPHGQRFVQWNTGNLVHNGIYTVQLKSGTKKIAKKFAILR